MQGGNINLGVGRIIPTLPEDACGAFLKPVLPLRNLVRMHIEVLRKLGKGFFALQSGQCHLGFKGRCVVPTWSSAHLLSSFRHFRRLGNRTSTYPAVRICETGSHKPYTELLIDCIDNNRLTEHAQAWPKCRSCGHRRIGPFCIESLPYPYARSSPPKRKLARSIANLKRVFCSVAPGM